MARKRQLVCIGVVGGAFLSSSEINSWNYFLCNFMHQSYFMSSLQIIAILIAIAVHFVFLYFVSNKFEKGWIKKLFRGIKETEKGTDMGLMTARSIIIIEAVIVFIIANGL